MNYSDAQQQLITVARDAHTRGWVPATSGNFSARLDDGDIAITVSGKDKGRLLSEDIMRISADGVPREQLRPSAETLLHVQLYKRDSMVNAVLHTHSVNATIASQTSSGQLVFEGLELLKAFAGVTTHETTIVIPIFDNTQDITSLSHAVEQHMLEHGQGCAYLIAGHGLYTWGANVQECARHLEALEYLFEYARLKPA